MNRYYWSTIKFGVQAQMCSPCWHVQSFVRKWSLDHTMILWIESEIEGLRVNIRGHHPSIMSSTGFGLRCPTLHEWKIGRIEIDGSNNCGHLCNLACGWLLHSNSEITMILWKGSESEAAATGCRKRILCPRRFDVTFWTHADEVSLVNTWDGCSLFAPYLVKG